MTTESAPIIANRYRLLDELGRGGMGVVHRAQDRLTGQTVALKQVLVNADALDFASKAPDGDSGALRLGLAREFRIMASLRHPFIVSVLDYGFDAQHQPYFTMRYIENALPLTAYAAESDDADKVALLLQLLSALHYLHRRGILHRDLKPDNVLVTAAGSVQVMDFGVALASQRDETSDEIAGTIAYLAPDVLQGAPPSVRADLWAVGVMAYELLAGEHPFASANISQMLSKILVDEPDLNALTPAQALWVGRLLAKDPAERYGDASEALEALCAALSLPLPDQSDAVRESYLQASNFVGRERELAHLRDALGRTEDGAVGFVLVGGESGVGKSRLVDELRTEALVRGAMVLRGGAAEGGGLPFQAWRPVLRQLLLSADLDAFEAGVLKALVPDVAALLGEAVPDVPALQGKGQQERLVLTLVDLFKRLRQPTLLILEDLQWTVESLLPLQQMLKVPQQLPQLLVLATYRNDERPDLPDDLAGFEVLQLERLSRETIASLSSAMLGDAGQNPQLVELLATETEGNTYFMVEVVRALAEDAGSLRAVGVGTLPQSVLTGGMQAVLERRLGQIAPVYERITQLAAIAGRELDTAVLQQSAPDVDVEAWLYAANAAAVLSVQDERWQFAHDKLREAVLQRIPAAARQGLYRAVATAIEAVHTETRDYDDVLLDLWRQAGDLEKELHYLEPVMKAVINVQGGARGALPELRRVLATLPDDHAQRPMLLLLIASAHNALGELQESHAVAEEALADALRSETAKYEMGARSQIATALATMGKLAEAETMHLKVIAQAEAVGDADRLPRAHSHLALVYYHQGRHDEARVAFEQSLAYSRAVGHERDAAGMLMNIGVLAYHAGESDKAIASYKDALAIFRRLGDRHSIAMCTENLGISYKNEGQVQESLAPLRESIAIYEAIGAQENLAGALNNLSISIWQLGDLEDALETSLRSVALYRKLGAERSISHSLINSAQIMMALTRYDDVPRYLHEALEIVLRNAIEALHAQAMLAWAEWFMATGVHQRAAELVGVASQLNQTMNFTRDTVEVLQTALREHLDSAQLETLIARGAALDPAAVSQALLSEYAPIDS